MYYPSPCYDIKQTPNTTNSSIIATQQQQQYHFIVGALPYDIVGYMEYHKSMFRGLANVFVGKLAPHITTEVDCESLYSQAGHAAQPNHNRTVAEIFERLVIANHRMARI